MNNTTTHSPRSTDRLGDDEWTLLARYDHPRGARP